MLTFFPEQFSAKAVLKLYIFIYIQIHISKRALNVTIFNFGKFPASASLNIQSDKHPPPSH